MDISIKTADGMTLEQLQKVIQDRKKYLNETTEDSIVAIGENILMSLRAATRVANEKKVKKLNIVQRTDLYPYYADGRLCLFYKGGRNRFNVGPHMFVHSRLNGEKAWKCKVFEFTDDFRGEALKQKFYLVAKTQDVAVAMAKQIVTKRIQSKKMLAKHMLSVLRLKLCNKRTNDNVSSVARNLASTLGEVIQSKSSTFGSGTYSLTIKDNLNYASSALKNGESDIQTSIRKAINKVVGLINFKINNNFFGAHKLDTPFPDLKKRK